jgi:hypothetical protein
VEVGVVVVLVEVVVVMGAVKVESGVVTVGSVVVTVASFAGVVFVDLRFGAGLAVTFVEVLMLFALLVVVEVLEVVLDILFYFC